MESNYHSSNEFFKISKKLKGGYKDNQIQLYDDNHDLVASTKEKLEITFKHFKKQLSNRDSQLVKDKLKKSLENPISIEKVQNAIKTLRNGRAPGKDGILAEFLKNGTSLAKEISIILNNIFEKGEDIDLGEGILIAIP